MGIQVADNFDNKSKKFLDNRTQYATLADMKAVVDNNIPEGFEAYCVATDKWYKFLSTNDVDANTGKWREREAGSGGTSDYTDLENKPSIEGVPLTGNKTASDLGLAKANQIPTVPTKVSQLQNDSGFITDSALPGVYAGDTAGLVPAAGSGNTGKFLQNDGSWETPPMPMIGTINRSDIYDTTEKVVGKWTDGRPIYQKTFTGTTPSVASNNDELFIVNYSESWNIDIGASVDTVIKLDGFVTLASGRSYQLREGTAANGWFTGWTTNNSHSTKPNKITLSTGSLSSLVSRPYVVTLTYTKTTDAANSYNYADENDYSTSEKIIGKWIDGKTLYQKVITGTLPTVDTDCTVVSKIVASLPNVRIIDFSGVRWGSDGLDAPILYSHNRMVNDTEHTYTMCWVYKKGNGDISINTDRLAISEQPFYLVLKYIKTS